MDRVELATFVATTIGATTPIESKILATSDKAIVLVRRGISERLTLMQSWSVFGFHNRSNVFTARVKSKSTR